jgi:hypothetical protein
MAPHPRRYSSVTAVETSNPTWTKVVQKLGAEKNDWSKERLRKRRFQKVA